MSRRVAIAWCSAEYGDFDRIIIVHPERVLRVDLDVPSIMKLWSVDWKELKFDLDLCDIIDDDDETARLERRVREVAQAMMLDLITVKGEDSKWIYYPSWALDTSRRSSSGMHCTGWDNVKGTIDDSVSGHRR